MNRFVNLLRCLGVCLAVAAGLAQAQPVGMIRTIPADALKAVMQPASGRTILLDDREFMLAPGGQVFNRQNLIVQPQSLEGKLDVRVKFDAQKMVQRVWILTEAEDEVEAPKLTESFWRRLLNWL